MSTQPGHGPIQHKDRVEQSTKVPDKVPFRSKLHSLLVDERNHIGITQMKESMKRGIDNVLAVVIELVVQNVDIKEKNVFSFFEDGANEYDPQTNSRHHTDEQL